MEFAEERPHLWPLFLRSEGVKITDDQSISDLKISLECLRSFVDSDDAIEDGHNCLLIASLALSFAAKYVRNFVASLPGVNEEESTVVSDLRSAEYFIDALYERQQSLEILFMEKDAEL